MSQSKALLFAVAAYFILVLSDTALKFCAEAGVSIFLFMFVFGGSSVLYCPAAALAKHDLSILKARCWREQMAIAACAVIINSLNVVSLKHLPLTIFYTIVFTIPLIVAVLSALLKYEVLTRTKIVCVIVGFIGAALAIGFDGKGGGDQIGYVCAFIGVGCFSTAIILLRKISGKDSVESVQFWRLLAVCVVGFIGMVVNGVSISFDSTFLILVVSSVLSLAGSFLFNYALKNTPSTNVVQFHYTQIIYGGVLGYLIWHEVPSWHLAAGAVLIIGSGLVVAANTRKLERGRPLTAQ